MKEIELAEFNNFCSYLKENWGLLSCEYNQMTISWGGLTRLWNKDIAIVYVRPNRYTYQLLEKNDYFTISFFDKTFIDDLTILGTLSGADTAKISMTKLQPLIVDDLLMYEESLYSLVLKKIYYTDIDPKMFLDPSIIDNYPNRDFHRMYFGEVVKVYAK